MKSRALFVFAGSRVELYIDVTVVVVAVVIAVIVVGWGWAVIVPGRTLRRIEELRRVLMIAVVRLWVVMVVHEVMVVMMMVWPVWNAAAAASTAHHGRPIRMGHTPEESGSGGEFVFQLEESPSDAVLLLVLLLA